MPTPPEYERRMGGDVMKYVCFGCENDPPCVLEIDPEPDIKPNHCPFIADGSCEWRLLETSQPDIQAEKCPNCVTGKLDKTIEICQCGYERKKTLDTHHVI